MSDLSLEIKLEIADESFRIAEKYYKLYFKAYRERVEKFYKSISEEEPDFFPFINPIEVIIIYQNYNYYIFFSNSKSNEDTVRYITDFIQDTDEYAKIKDMPEHIQDKRLLEKAKIGKYIENDKGNYGMNFPKPDINFHIPYSEQSGREKCDEHYHNYEFSKAFKEANMPSSDFPLFEMDLIYSLVNNEQFKYELEESVKAYNSELFLASIVTAAVSLETLLKISIINKLGEDYLPKEDRKKYTLNYAQILLNQNVIDERLNHRIRAINELRRGGAHSKTGKIEQWDAEQIISGIRIIVEFIFNVRN
ncbi:hypothetical protein [Peribacillus loiseleuriae]|uniref:DUF4145 domain-containing protein n=1 Tax=Peribacillus loiseleuriae TaxID=1679170 RepID=A0A0K9GRH1_9BACI|nr:hypothetical protein [Peribacillus loiseleuriae]KMY49196.1 hypothetical protein AC625_06400 [Peribacillus loiseleuriae]